MKKSLKTFVLGLVAGIIITATPAIANTIWERIDVVRNRITVMVDGKELQADNFLYQDTTYVPIRAVAEALGKNVTYEDGVAYIGESYAAEFGGEEVDLGNGYTATTEEIAAYEELYAHDPAMQGATPEQIRAAALSSIMQYNALADIALENNIVVGKEFYDAFTNIMAYMEMNYGSREAMEKAMNDAGYSYEMYKRYQETEYLYSELLKSPAFAATPDEIAKYYADNAAMFPYDGVQAKHVLISAMDENGKEITDPAVLKALKERADSVYNLATSGADFDKLVADYGEDPGMVSNPDGYTFTKGEMVAEFEEAAFALKDGEISEPVKTSYGWHIIKKIKTVESMPLTAELSSSIGNVLAHNKIMDAVNAKLK
ncbi:MAG: peptidylprolyl isomerase [Clostridia bacterium]|nr:peptidylprolyl isomerase [Clostridia bacterium]